jgi:hypothetical protein
MSINLEDYYILSRIFLGKNLVITFQNMTDIHSRRVLELIEVEGFIDQSTTDEIKTLRLDEEGGSYPHDLSIRLKRPEIMKFPEVFFFTDKDEVHFNFRACARKIHFREWLETDVWLK